MFPFWDLAIAPILAAINTKRCVEIGALRGETTIRMLEDLGPDAELHVIDPVPSFDPGEHERAFPGRYIFHRDLSLNVLDDLPTMDAALIDGDHNWYTVYNECKALAKVARDNDAPLPVMILHDVCWPYGRRDLYYGPDGVPAEFRQPFAQQGMGIGIKKLLPGGGLNPTMYNALEEGGPRNGVMTGLDDFIAEYEKPLRLVVLPIYFGLAIVAEVERLERQPELAEVLDHLESAEGRQQLLELGENIRLNSMIFEHAIFYQREQGLERLARRYLGVVKKALLNEHHLENEIRVQYLALCLEKGMTPRADDLRDPSRYYEEDFKALVTARRAGRSTTAETDLSNFFPYTDMGSTRLDHLHASLDVVRKEAVEGDLMECGTGRGGGAIFLRAYLDAHEMLGRQVWVADRFRPTALGDDRPTADRHAPEQFRLQDTPGLGADLNTVRDGFDRFDLLDDSVRFLQGELAHTIPNAPIEKLALLRIGHDIGEDTIDVLDDLYGKVALGGLVIVAEYGIDEGCRVAVDEFRTRSGVTELLERVDGVTVFWRKLAEPVAPAEPLAQDPAITRDTEAEAGSDSVSESPTAGDRAGSVAGLSASAKSLLKRAPGSEAIRARIRRPREERHPVTELTAVGAPLASPIRSGAKDLSVVVVFYNMRREAARTLQSLSRSYQRGIDDLDYEVIVIENGSTPDQKLGEDFVRGFGPEFRYIDLGDHAQKSPVFAMNHGLEAAGGENIAFMIDGAHVLTPGVLRHAMAGLRTYAPSLVATQQWYVGPGQQPSAIRDGYDQDYEDRLFEQIEFPADGYRLFDIGHFIGDRDWFDGLWESNCIFVPRSVLEQVGAFDESFKVAGGGYANLELYERLASTPGVSMTTILGEGSFHQAHGGTTTNQTDTKVLTDSIIDYSVHFDAIRGKDYHGQGKELFYVGTMSPGAMRTRARRRTAAEFFQKGMANDPDGLPTKGGPIPDELKNAYTQAYWTSLGWKTTTWLGRTVGRTPADMVTYQELIADIRPDWVITLRTGNGGQAQFLASLCDLVGHGQVLSIDDREQTDLPDHPRIRYLVTETHGPDTTAKVAEIVGDNSRAIVFLGTRGGGKRMFLEFETYQQFVTPGSYLVMEDTVVNGHPVWPSFGPGPHEAANQIINNYTEFIADESREKKGLSFNPGGYLLRRQ